MSRERLPPERPGYTRVFRLPYTHRDGTQDVMQLYFTANLKPDEASCGEVFVTADRGGSLARGALDATAMMMSIMLQHGIPLEMITGKLKGIRFKPDGFTGDPEIPSCTSPIDLLAKWLELKFLPKEILSGVPT